MGLVSTPVAYLDTNHVSRLARVPTSPDVQAALSLLDGEQAILGISVLHILELSDPKFVDRAAVGRLLDDLPIAWGKFPQEIWPDEIRSALARSLGTKQEVAVFFDSMESAWHDSAASVSPSTALDVLAKNPKLRAGMQRAKNHGVQMDAIKRNAVVVKDRVEPLVQAMQETGLSVTPAGLHLPRPLEPREILEKAGGPESLPAWNVFQLLHINRLNDSRFDTDPNDIVDELHVCYGPYVQALIVDRRTLGRVKSARLPFADRVGRRLSDLPQLLK